MHGMAQAALGAASSRLKEEAEQLLSDLASRFGFVNLLSQRQRLLQMDTALPGAALIPERTRITEAVDAPFEIEIDALSTSAYFELASLVGEQITLRLLRADGSYRPWHGYVLRAAQLGGDGGLARYRISMAPWLSLLQQRRDSFMFQDLTALEIIEEVFKDHRQANWRVAVTDTLRRRSVCTQYRETDFEFVTRLLAEEGLSYHFEHLDGDAAAEADRSGQARHCMVIQDTQAAR